MNLAELLAVLDEGIKKSLILVNERKAKEEDEDLIIAYEDYRKDLRKMRATLYALWSKMSSDDVLNPEEARFLKGKISSEVKS